MTSQVLANIYLHPFDLMVCHHIKPLYYSRYGDDFLVFGQNQAELLKWREEMISYLANKLGLKVNPKSDFVLPVRRGIRFLGSWLYPNGRKLQNRNRRRAQERLNRANQSSYRGLIEKNENQKHLRIFDWQTLIMLGENDGD